ncbi:hypothetical protein B0H17DRAFT_1215907 [Mycena rosella]|uniref:Uncharacterized protein n=1 Tax=Mycena rosella TaxID=1033263 RepID=A0AAD7CD11_MYCRO|nr:hypothetical protein B0H17DRAFT_1215907 [Mycena rosella]
MYLVSGRNVEFPGVYVSWPSAAAQYHTTSSATVKKYKTWASLQAAWFAGCDRGEHDHPTSNDPQQPSMDGTLAVRSSAAPSSSQTFAAPHLLPSREARHVKPLWSPSAPGFPSPAPAATDTRSRSPARDAAAIPGKMAYAVRHNGQGVVFDDYSVARTLYHKIQAEGGSPALASSPSLTEGICFIEEFCAENSSAEGSRRRRWIEEERAARTRRVVRTWGYAVDSWRKGGNGVWTSESDESEGSDESSVSTE